MPQVTGCFEAGINGEYLCIKWSTLTKFIKNRKEPSNSNEERVAEAAESQEVVHSGGGGREGGAKGSLRVVSSLI